jgi:hypothetical protein
MLVRFLCSRDEQARRNRDGSDLPTIPKLYDAPELLVVNPTLPRVQEIFRKGIALRPAESAGTMYPEVSRAYFETVHAVLIRKKPAAQAAGELEDQLQLILKTSGVGANANLEHGR